MLLSINDGRLAKLVEHITPISYALSLDTCISQMHKYSGIQ